MKSNLTGSLPAKARQLNTLSFMEAEAAESTAVSDSGPQVRPCSASQKRLWLLDRLQPGNPALNMAVRWRLQGGISSAHVDQAFAVLLRRHAVLRTFIAESDGEPLQVIEPSLAFSIPQVDLRGMTEHEALAESEQIALLEARTSFDLSVAPLIRVTHLRIRDDVSIILVTAHQIICDARSIGILAHELQRLCSAMGHGDSVELMESWRGESEKPPPLISEVEKMSDEQFWRNRLKGLKHFELYSDRPRPAMRTFNGNVVSLLLERDATERLQQLSVRQGCTLQTGLTAVLFALLNRYTEQDDIAIGSLVTEPEDNESKDNVGPMAWMTLLRCDLSGNPSFAALLAQTAMVIRDAHSHSSTPLNRMIEILQPKRDLSRDALFSVSLVIHARLESSTETDGLGLSEMPAYSAGVLYDMMFSILEMPGGWQISCEYNTDLFTQETAIRLLHHFDNLMAAAAEDPIQAIHSMSLLDEQERYMLVADCNQTLESFPIEMTVPELFQLQVQRTPDAIALVCGDQAMSYRQLDLASNHLAHELHARGIDRGSLVGICLDRSPDLLVALLAVLKAGGAYIPLDPAYPSLRLAQILEDAKPALVIAQRSSSSQLPDVATPMILLDKESGSINKQPDTTPQRRALQDDLAYIIYTSGSTGKPKGVQVQHRSLTNLLCSMRRRPGLSAEDTLVSVTTVSFDIAALEMFLPLMVGAKIVLARENEIADGASLLQLLRLHQATVMQATPVTWQILLAAGWNGDPKIKILCGGEAMSRTLADELLAQGGELWNLYGPTETTIYSLALRVEPGTEPVLLGPPIANTQCYVLDRHGNLMPEGVPGELYIGGEGVSAGYLNLPDRTRERFVPDTFRSAPGATLYRTGDLVRRKPHGNMEFLGRSDHQIKLRGFRIELGEIESVLQQQSLAECVVVAATDPSGESAIHAYVVPLDAAGMQAEKLIAQLRSALSARLPAYMVPSAIVVLQALPRMPNGKIDRHSLPAPPAMREEVSDPGHPVSAIQSRLSAIWTQILGIPHVPAHANFFEVGGHSLLAVKLLVRLEAEFGQKLSLATLFKWPTIADQARLLEKGDSRNFDFRQVLKLQSNGSRLPLIAINNTGIYYVLSKRLGADQPFISLQLFDPALPQATLPVTLEDIASAYTQLIRRVQKNGPYALLGWCVAGTLAFEVARQLTESGQKVSRLFMFDTLAPGYLGRLSRPRALLADYAYRWKLIVADWARTRQDKRGFAEFWSNRTFVKRVIAWNSSQPAAVLPDDNSRTLSPEQYDQWLLQHLEDAAQSYEPKCFDGAVTLFRSSSEPQGLFIDPRMGWSDFVTAGLEVVEIQGDHFSIFQEPHVAQMAQHIESAMNLRS